MNRRGESQRSTGRGKIPFLVAVLAIVGVAGVVLGLKRQEREVLRHQLDLARREADELKRVRQENEILRQRQPTAADLERLRSDHVALLQLRAEMESLRKQ